jgi:hypothetical protein
MQQQMRQQDEALDHISVHVDRIKQTGQLMHEELEEQVGRLLANESFWLVIVLVRMMGHPSCCACVCYP